MPEVATFAVLIVGAAAVGNADIWRYLVFLLPAITILFAAYVQDFQPGPVLLTAALLLTLVTQGPFAQMDMTHYFRDWFPAYVSRTNDATPEFWSAWRLRIAMTGAGAIAIGILQWSTRRGDRVGIMQWKRLQHGVRSATQVNQRRGRSATTPLARGPCRKSRTDSRSASAGTVISSVSASGDGH
jgi:hypothetical protein